MSRSSRMAEFDRQIRTLCGDLSEGRPFLCNGSPFDCEIFLVGINPATDVPLKPYWSLDHGCNKAAWLEAYREKHPGYRPTRDRIQRLFEAAAPAQILETNVFHFHSKREAILPKSHRTTAVFDFLLKTVKPRIMFVYGRSAVRHVEQLLNVSLTLGEFASVQHGDRTFEVRAGHHLAYQWSFDAVDKLGHELRERCSSHS